jgi:uncharacterized YigZ family protein
MKKKITYKTIKKSSGPILFKDRKSKFYGYAYGVKSTDEIKSILKDLQQKYPSANHICYAWRLGQHPTSYRANDDGEPTNSAGLPIYRQIEATGLSNSLIIVVRFFGGTKLGVGGLINAYRATAKLAIEESVISTLIIEDTFELHFKYPDMNAVMRLLKQKRIKIHHQELKDNCIITIKVMERDSAKTALAFEDLYGVMIKKIIKQG